jgi:hypothetical protein
MKATHLIFSISAVVLSTAAIAECPRDLSAEHLIDCIRVEGAERSGELVAELRAPVIEQRRDNDEHEQKSYERVSLEITR